MNTYFLNLSESLVDQFPTQDRFVTDLNLNFQPVFFFFFLNCSIRHYSQSS